MRTIIRVAIVATLTLAASVEVSSAPSPAKATTASAQLRSGCHRGDPFGPSVKQMKHFFWCKTGRRIQVVGSVVPTITAAGQPKETPRPLSGGPSCEWYAYHVAKVCYHSGGIPQFLCTRYYADETVYGWHCGATEAFNRAHAEGLWSVVKRLFTSHQAKRCLVGSSPSVMAGVIVRGGPAGPWGIAASAGAGCVAGILSYWWH